MGGIFALLVMVILGIAGIIALFVGSIGPGLALLVLAAIAFFIGSELLVAEERKEELKRQAMLMDIQSGHYSRGERKWYND